MEDYLALNQEEENVLYWIAEQLTGSCQDQKKRRRILVSNVLRRMRALRAPSLEKYLYSALSSADEYEEFISALTIHTTSWFRESPHFQQLTERLNRDYSKGSATRFQLLSVACSSGQEPYSYGLVLELFRQRVVGFDYSVTGVDIDPRCVKYAKKGLYPTDEVSQIPQEYRRLLLRGGGDSTGLFTASPDIRKRSSFYAGNLLDEQKLSTIGGPFDLISCRNVLIYFAPTQTKQIISTLVKLLSTNGTLVLGHSEAVDGGQFGLRLVGNTTYIKDGGVRATVQPKPKPEKAERHKVLVVDDSETMRKMLVKLLTEEGHEAWGVESAAHATEFLREKSVDLVTLDLHMEGMDGATWLRTQRRSGFRVPIVVVSGASAHEAMEVLGALEDGAQDYIDKGSIRGEGTEIAARLISIAQGHKEKARTPAKKKRSQRPELKLHRPDLIAIGASTGGTETLTHLLRSLPSDAPPVVVVQHISKSFCRPFAERLAGCAGLTLAEPGEGAPILPGHLYMAWDDYHIGVQEKGASMVLTVSDSPPVSRHRPSVDHLFFSAAKLQKQRVFAALLTGMGADGAAGLAALDQAGALTCAQDEESCVVFGMPKEAIKLGAAKFIGSPDEIRDVLNKCLVGERKRK